MSRNTAVGAGRGRQPVDSGVNQLTLKHKQEIIYLVPTTSIEVVNVCVLFEYGFNKILHLC